MKYVEMILSFEDASIIKFPTLVDKVKEWASNGIRFIRLVTDSVKPDYIIHFSGSSNNPVKSTAPSFNELYEKVEDPNAQNITILKALYNHVSPEIILTIINSPLSSKNAYIQGLLAESNGYLIYKHQLEQFIMDNLGLDAAAATTLRKDWNKKSVRKREPLIQSEHYFLIESKMPQYFVFNKPEQELLGIN
jgi:hypothetical protein